MYIITTTNSSTNWKPTNKKVDKLSDLNRNNTCLVHMTNYLPVNGEILSIRNAKKDINGVSPNRNTIHFSFNKTVSPTNIGQVWNNRSVGIIIPFDKILDETPKEDIIGGQMEDFYIKNRVKLPEGSVIVRKSDKVPSGTLKIINAEKIDEFKNTKGLTVIETSDNVSKVTDECIDMMGYTNINYKLSEDTDIPVKYFEMTPQERNTDFKMQTLVIKNSNKLFDSISDLNQFWVNLSNENNLKTYKLHALSPYGRSDYLIDSVHILANTTNSWMSEINQTNPFSEETIQQKIDYKKEFLDIADNILKKKKDDEILNYDLDKFKQNIIESKTPKEAMDKLKDEQKLTGYIDFNDVKRDNIELNENDVYLTIDQLLGINPISKMMFNV